MTQYTLFELNEYFRRIMALNFPDALWVSCELAQVNESRGHLYLDLVQKAAVEDQATGQIIAQSEAVIWGIDHRRLRRKLGMSFQQILQPGLEVLVQVKVEFHERYGLKLRILDIDPAFTVGKLELKKQATLKSLQQSGLLGKNKEHRLAPVLQRIAVISSERAAGLQDFRQQLKDNPYAYKFEVALFSAAMQGDLVTKEVTKRLKEINAAKEQFDCVVIIRGGGAKLDLLAFDEEQLCQAIANCELPVITGIGHDIDETIADMVAYQALKTPTAVAEWLVQQNLYFEMGVLEAGRMIQLQAQGLFNEAMLSLQHLSQTIPLNAQNQIQQQHRLLQYIEEELPRRIAIPLRNENKRLEHLETMLSLLDPQKVLERGFSMTLKEGQLINDWSDLEVGDTIESVLAKGRVKSKVIKK